MQHYYCIVESKYDYIFTFTSGISIISLCFQDVTKSSFTFTQRTLFSISCKASLIIMNTLSICLFRNVSISPLFLKNSFIEYRILGL